ncbi:MAG: catalase-related domain-containing protein [Bacillota bacterium]|nr:catalase-related domain-containing protein [Bacillota bacterium]
MKELIQARNFYHSLTDAQREDLVESIAADIFFLEEELQMQVTELLEKVDDDLGKEIRRRNKPEEF